jgi:hypothetical protein
MKHTFIILEATNGLEAYVRVEAITFFMDSSIGTCIHFGAGEEGNSVTVRETPEQISEIIDEFTDGEFVRYRPSTLNEPNQIEAMAPEA